MGLFNGKKSSADSEYVNIDGEMIPVAVAVVAPPPPSSGNGGAMVPVHNKQSPVPGSKQGAVYIGRNSAAAPPPMIFMTRSPTVIGQCPTCTKKNIRTRTVTGPDWITWVTVAMLLVVFWPLCWIPLVTDSCRKTTHYCIACGAAVGSIRPFKDCCVKHR